MARTIHTQPAPLLATPHRHTAAPLPPYRYVPDGVWPHPKGEGGHAVTPDSAEPPRPPTQWREQWTYLYGVDLYNHAYWWEAHEAWEALWSATADATQRQFLHGLIQLAAALLKWHERRPRGVRILSGKARDKLRRVADSDALEQERWYMGVDLPRFLERLDQAFSPFDRDEAYGWPTPGSELSIELAHGGC